MTKLQGVWAPGMVLRQRDQHAPGVFARVTGERAKVTLEASAPSMHALHYAIAGNRLMWDEYEWRLRKRLRLSGMKGTPQLVQAGETVTFDGKTPTITRKAYAYPEPLDITMADAVPLFGLTFLQAVQEMYEADGSPPVTMLLSGGTDSIATLWALKTIGADVRAVTVGTSEKDFDPLWAKRVAHHWKIKWDFIPLPTDDTGLEAILRDAIGTIEQTSFSNVLMACCREVVRPWMVRRGRPYAWLGYEADAILGNKILQVGRHRAGAATSEAWGRQRKDSVCESTAPYTLQNAKSFRVNGETNWRTPFVHPKVADLLYSFPLEVIPADLTKPVLYKLLEHHLPPHLRPWDFKKKIGFYTGSGIGTVRLTNPVLQDENMRRIYAEERARRI